MMWRHGSSVEVPAQGIVGEGYTRVLNGEAHSLPDDGTFYGNPDDYLLPEYFPQAAPASHMLLMPARKSYRKLLAAPKAATEVSAAAAAHFRSDALPDAGAGGFGNEESWLKA